MKKQDQKGKKNLKIRELDLEKLLNCQKPYYYYHYLFFLMILHVFFRYQLNLNQILFQISSLISNLITKDFTNKERR